MVDKLHIFNKFLMILVTGYGRFGRFEVNPSWEAVRKLPKSINNYPLHCTQLSVEYVSTKTSVLELIHTLQPSLIVHVGVGKPGHIYLETLAHNDGYTKPDNLSYCPPGGYCYPESANAQFYTAIDPNIFNCLKWNIQCSTDAGRFLCEFVLATSLAKVPKSIFIHLPPVGLLLNLGEPFTHQEHCDALFDILNTLTEHYTGTLNSVVKRK
jgi:pyroglutamyl-peptidase